MLRIDQVFSGPATVGDTWFIRSHEPWSLVDGERQLSHSGCVRLETGDRAVGAIIGDGSDADHSALMTHDSYLLLTRDGQVADTFRDKNPVIVELESLSEAALGTAVEAALQRRSGTG